ncbi:MAG: ABC transporter ATP-binding protein [Acidimicrobiales bacterium]|nr:ABC transporter ATP-binding protein [Acidimicrobiales bacterium]
MTGTTTPLPRDIPDAVPAVVLDGVSRVFGPVRALDRLDLVVPTQSITVLLGPNGAGKTTAVRMITGALDPHGGSVRVFGLDPAHRGEEVRRRCGVVSAKPALYDRLSGWDNLRYAAQLYGLGRNADGRIREAAARFEIEHALDQQVGGYSTGMKTRLALSRSVLHEPDLLLFDEPTSGLDPESSYAVLDLIRQMRTDGSTIVMCTHLLLEAEGLAEQIVVLDEGTNLVSGTNEELVARYWPGLSLRLEAEDPATLDQLRHRPGVLGYQRQSLATVQLDEHTAVADVVADLVAAGVRLTRVEPHRPSLEDLYFAVRSEARAARAASTGGETP